MQYFSQMKLNNYSWLTVYVSLHSVAFYIIWYHFIYLAETFMYFFFFFFSSAAEVFIQIESNLFYAVFFLISFNRVGTLLRVLRKKK